MLVARRFLLSGRVQGVGFRWYAREAAAVENLAGWVRNLPDGRVEALVQGERESVDRFGRQLARGPRGAHVDDVETYDEVPGESSAGFEIRG
jgi:acylphosphatase